MGGTYPYSGKARAQGFRYALAPSDAAKALWRKGLGQFQHRNGLMMRIACQVCFGFAAKACRRRADRLMFAPPNSGAWTHAERIDQILLTQPIAQGRVIAIGRVSQHRPRGTLACNAASICTRAISFLVATLGIIRPLAGQIQTVAQGQAPCRCSQ